MDRPEFGIMRDSFGKNQKAIFPKKGTLFTNKDAIFRKSL